MRKTLTGGALALTALAIAAPAQGANVDVGSGATTLRLDAGTASALTGAGFNVAPVSPAKAGRAGIAFPITGGRVDDATARGAIRHSGGLRLRRGDTTVRLTRFTVSVRRGLSTLSARVNGGARAHVIRLGLNDARVRKADDGGLVVSRVTANLTGRGAAALNAAFKVRLFQPGLSLGRVTVRATPANVRFTGGATSLALDAGTATALQGAGIAPGAVGPATAGDDGRIAFPIAPSTVNATTLFGTIRHTGGLSFAKGSAVVRLTDFDVVIDKAPSLRARVNGSGKKVEILDLELTGTNPPTATARLTKAAADALNQALATDVFQAGLVVGTATVQPRT